MIDRPFGFGPPRTRIVTCRTERCENSGQAIRLHMPFPDGEPVICGACNYPITDVEVRDDESKGE